MLTVFSGQCALCDTGIETPYLDFRNKPLFTGDIVLTFTEGGLGLPDSLTVVVRDEFENISGRPPRRIEPSDFFVMGIRSVPLDGPTEWRVMKVKDHSDVIAGEHWKAYGFRYAKAIETRQGQDLQGLGAQHESAVAQPFAKVQP